MIVICVIRPRNSITIYTRTECELLNYKLDYLQNMGELREISEVLGSNHPAYITRDNSLASVATEMNQKTHGGGFVNLRTATK